MASHSEMEIEKQQAISWLLDEGEPDIDRKAQ